MVQQLYQIKQLKNFRILEGAYSDPETELVREDGDLLLYSIGNNKLVEAAIDMGAIEKYSESAMITIFSPEKLQDMIVNVDRMRYNDMHTEYIIHTNRGDITLKTRDLLNTGGWRDAMFDNCKILLAFDGRNKKTGVEWGKLLAWIGDNTSDVWVETESIDDMEGDIIMSHIQGRLKVVLDKDDFYYYTVYDDGHGIYYVRSDILKELVEGLGYKFTSHTRKVLKSHLFDVSAQMKLAGKRFSVWKFVEW